MAWRVMIPKKISTMFSHDPGVGVKCMVIRGSSPARSPRPGACAWRSYRPRCAAASPGIGLRDRRRPYEQLAAYYWRAGQPDAVRRVLLARRRHRRTTLGALGRMLGRVLDATVG